MNWDDVFADIEKWMEASNQVMKRYPLTSKEYWNWLIGSLGHLEQKYDSHPLVVNFCVAIFTFQADNYDKIKGKVEVEV